jgi:hypothetical protein
MKYSCFKFNDFKNQRNNLHTALNITGYLLISSLKFIFSGEIKLSDFGSSRFVGEKLKTFWSTIDYLAPGKP